jgi:hypothetical protein
LLKIPTQESILPGWESPGLFRRFTNTGFVSPVVAYPYDWRGFVGGKKKTIVFFLSG